MKDNQKKINGFSLVEILVAMAIGTIVVAAAYFFFPMGSKIAREGEAINQLSQSARVILNRVGRDIRQTPDIITNLPPTQSEATDQIFVEDGYPDDQDVSPHYIKYIFQNNKIYRQEIHYTDLLNPESVVAYDFSGAVTVEETNEVIGEDIEFFKLWEEQSLVKIDIKLKKLNDNIRFLSTVYPRND